MLLELFFIDRLDVKLISRWCETFKSHEIVQVVESCRLRISVRKLKLRLIAIVDFQLKVECILEVLEII